MKATCRDCGKEWGGFKAAHCTVCHLTFATVLAFDSHQRTLGRPPECKDPSSVGLVYSPSRNAYRFMNVKEENDANRSG